MDTAKTPILPPNITIAYLKKIIDLLPGHVYWKDKNLHYLGCNLQQAKSLGFESAEEIVGKTDYDLSSEKDAKAFEIIDRSVIENQKMVEAEEEIVYADGRRAVVLSKKVPFFDDNNKIAGIIGISVDITDRKQIEESLKAAKENAEATSKAKSAFILNIQHDIRTPFNSLYLSTEYLYSIEEAAEKKEMLGFMLQSTKRLLDYCNEIIAFGQAITNGIVLHEKKFNLFELIQSMIDAEMVGAKLKKLLLAFHIDESVPRAVVGDSFALERILISLISNSIKFTEEGSIKLTVSYIKSLSNREVILRFAVEDTGIGIPKDKQPILFEMFAKVHYSNTETYQGQGLGLFLAKECVEKMGGDIELQSEEGRGTTVRFDVPFRIPLTDDCL